MYIYITNCSNETLTFLDKSGRIYILSFANTLHLSIELIQSFSFSYMLTESISPQDQQFYFQKKFLVVIAKSSIKKLNKCQLFTL